MQELVGVMDALGKVAAAARAAPPSPAAGAAAELHLLLVAQGRHAVELAPARAPTELPGEGGQGGEWMAGALMVARNV
jgi:hypothetical protein